jgi:hypothetical protein
VLDAALAELEAIDPESLSDDALHALLIEMQTDTGRFAAQRARVVAAWDARGAWADDGSKAAWGRLARECSLSAQTAKAEVGRAKKLRSMPITAAAFGEGKMSVDQVDVLCTAMQPGVRHLFERDETVLVNELVGLRYHDGRRLVDYWIEQACTEADRERSRPDPVGRRVSVGRSFDGHLNLSGWLDPIAGTEFVEELESIEQELFEADWAAARADHGDRARPKDLPRTAAQRRHDALSLMARNSRACRQGAFRHPSPLITIHVGYGTFSRMCELADGTVVSPSQVFPLLCEADIERIVFDGPSRVIDVGVRQRFFTGALRRAIEVRDRHCQDHSGCDVPAERCHGDHRIPYALGGLTTQENGRCLCPVHNRQRVGHEHEEEHPPDDDYD